MENFNEALKSRICELAKEHGLSLPALEKELGLGNGTIVKWNKSTPNAGCLKKVAEYFGVSTDYLLGLKTVATMVSDDELSLLRKIRELTVDDMRLLTRVVDCLCKASQERDENAKIK